MGDVRYFLNDQGHRVYSDDGDAVLIYQEASEFATCWMHVSEMHND